MSDLIKRNLILKPLFLIDLYTRVTQVRRACACPCPTAVAPTGVLCPENVWEACPGGAKSARSAYLSPYMAPPPTVDPRPRWLRRAWVGWFCRTFSYSLYRNRYEFLFDGRPPPNRERCTAIEIPLRMGGGRSQEAVGGHGA